MTNQVYPQQRYPPQGYQQGYPPQPQQQQPSSLGMMAGQVIDKAGQVVNQIGQQIMGSNPIGKKCVKIPDDISELVRNNFKEFRILAYGLVHMNIFSMVLALIGIGAGVAIFEKAGLLIIGCLLLILQSAILLYGVVYANSAMRKIKLYHLRKVNIPLYFSLFLSILAGISLLLAVNTEFKDDEQKKNPGLGVAFVITASTLVEKLYTLYAMNRLVEKLRRLELKYPKKDGEPVWFLRILRMRWYSNRFQWLVSCVNDGNVYGGVQGDKYDDSTINDSNDNYYYDFGRGYTGGPIDGDKLDYDNFGFY